MRGNEVEAPAVPRLRVPPWAACAFQPPARDRPWRGGGFPVTPCPDWPWGSPCARGRGPCLPSRAPMDRLSQAFPGAWPAANKKRLAPDASQPLTISPRYEIFIKFRKFTLFPWRKQLLGKKHLIFNISSLNAPDGKRNVSAFPVRPHEAPHRRAFPKNVRLVLPFAFFGLSLYQVYAWRSKDQ